MWTPVSNGPCAALPRPRRCSNLATQGSATVLQRQQTSATGPHSVAGVTRSSHGLFGISATPARSLAVGLEAHVAVWRRGTVPTLLGHHGHRVLQGLCQSPPFCIVLLTCASSSAAEAPSFARAASVQLSVPEQVQVVLRKPPEKKSRSPVPRS